MLSACLLHPKKWWYLSDLALHLGVTPSTLQRELASLVEVELLESRRDGNRVYYRTNMACPGVQELQGLLIKTAGIADVVRSTLRKFMGEIEVAFIYGSMAGAEELSASDVDVIIIGEVKLSDLAASIKKTEKTLGREINPTIFSPNELRHKMKDGDAFLKTVWQDKKIFLKGDESELEAMAQSGRPAKS